VQGLLVVAGARVAVTRYLPGIEIVCLEQDAMQAAQLAEVLRSPGASANARVRLP